MNGYYVVEDYRTGVFHTLGQDFSKVVEWMTRGDCGVVQYLDSPNTAEDLA